MGRLLSLSLDLYFGVSLSGSGTACQVSQKVLPVVISKSYENGSLTEAMFVFLAKLGWSGGFVT